MLKQSNESLIQAHESKSKDLMNFHTAQMAERSNQIELLNTQIHKVHTQIHKVLINLLRRNYP